jgi:hypothetical protein
MGENRSTVSESVSKRGLFGKIFQHFPQASQADFTLQERFLVRVHKMKDTNAKPIHNVPTRDNVLL